MRGICEARGQTWVQEGEDVQADVMRKPGEEILAVVRAGVVEDRLHVDREQVHLGTVTLIL